MKTVDQFRMSVKSYVKKNGDLSTYEHPRSYCRYCESKRQAQNKLSRELMGTVDFRSRNSVSVSLKTVLNGVKKRMNTEPDMELKYAWARVGLELNNLMLNI
jgi:hypothetical protein